MKVYEMGIEETEEQDGDCDTIWIAVEDGIEIQKINSKSEMMYVKEIKVPPDQAAGVDFVIRAVKKEERDV
jgi:hypothetical protein